MKNKMAVTITVCCAILAVVVMLMISMSRRAHVKIKAEAIAVLSCVAVALESADRETLLARISIPTALQKRTPDEQYRFISAALEGEVSEEGLKILKKDGEFGALMKIFPDEGSRWATIAKVDPAACVAFKLERDEFTAEAAVATNGTPKVIRLNDVRRLARETL